MPLAAVGLGRRRKLLDGAQFKAVFEQKILIHGKYFNLHVAPNTLSFPRLGLSVSRRISKKANQRNRIKRQIRESFRMHQMIMSPMDCVVISKAGGADHCNQELRKDLDNLWNRADRKCARCQKKL